MGRVYSSEQETITSLCALACNRMILEGLFPNLNWNTTMFYLDIGQLEWACLQISWIGRFWQWIMIKCTESQLIIADTPYPKQKTDNSIVQWWHRLFLVHIKSFYSVTAKFINYDFLLFCRYWHAIYIYNLAHYKFCLSPYALCFQF